jgi:hypothetical protein
MSWAGIFRPGNKAMKSSDKGSICYIDASLGLFEIPLRILGRLKSISSILLETTDVDKRCKRKKWK